jgi:hypothetical protein
VAGEAGVNQSYLPKAYCWNRRNVQVATSIRDTLVVPFLASKACSGVLAYSGYRKTATSPSSDHLCGYALDLVPKAGATLKGRAQLLACLAYAKVKRFPYTEFVWQSDNHHGHVSFRRCP